MTKENLTPWFGSDTVPFRKGVYEVDSPFGSAWRWYSRWDGKRWRFPCLLKDSAEKEKTFMRRERCDWRGLAEKPE